MSLKSSVRATVLAAAGIAVLGGGLTNAFGGLRQAPEGYQQILPRGGIPSIDSPVYVTAEQANIRDEAWVMGIVIDGQARAYSLEILNRHEVVNDVIGEQAFAAVW